MSLRPGTRLMMTADTVGGVWTFAVTLARSLGAAGFPVLLVTLGPRPTSGQRDMITGVPRVSLVEADLQLEWQDPAGTDVIHARAVLGALAETFAPDVIHVNGFREATFDWKAPTIIVAHSCANSWAAACGETGSFASEDWSVYTSNVRSGLENATAWVAPTYAFRDMVVRQYDLSSKGYAIWNGVDGNNGSSQGKLPFILSAGRVWDKAKNMSALASVAPEIDWPIKIAGPSSVAGKGLRSVANGCEFLGEISHEALLRKMKTASIFVSPGLYEPFGLSVLQAAKAGCALLLSDIPTFRELWDGAALFFDPRDQKMLVTCLRSLCRGDLQRTRLQRAAAERARRYPLCKTVDAYRLLYAGVLASGAGRSCSTKSQEMWP